MKEEYSHIKHQTKINTSTLQVLFNQFFNQFFPGLPTEILSPKAERPWAPKLSLIFTKKFKKQIVIQMVITQMTLF